MTLSKTKPITPLERKAILATAAKAAKQAYSPYSKFRVGAAVLGTKGIYRGGNIENASFGLTLCAERSALAAAFAAGESNIRAIAIACVDLPRAAAASERMPCGACRQWIAELAPNAEILIHGYRRSFALHDLLPKAFRLSTPAKQKRAAPSKRKSHNRKA